MKIYTKEHGPLQVKATRLVTTDSQILLFDIDKLVGGFPKSSVSHITKHGEAIYTCECEMES